MLEGQTVERSYAAEKRAELMDRLDYKVEAVINFAGQVENLTEVGQPEKIDSLLDDIWSQTQAMFSPGKIAALEKLTESVEETRRAHGRIDKFVTDQTITVEQLKREKTRIVALRAEQGEIMDDEDVQFLLNMRDLIDNLRQKNKIIEDIGNDRDKIIDEFNDHVPGENIKPEDIVDIRRTPFEITIVLKEEAYQKTINDDGFGWHFRRTPFSLVSNKPEVEKTVRHETIHNFNETIPGISQFSDERLTKIKKSIAEEELPEIKTGFIDLLLDFDPTVLVNQMQDELLAELENWENSIWNQERPKILQFDPNRPKTFEFHSVRYSTAGSNAREIVNIFKSSAKLADNEQQKKALLELSDKFIQQFVQVVEHMRQALMTARKHGDKAVERLHALLFVLPPSRYRHLERYLNYKYSDEIIEN